MNGLTIIPEMTKQISGKNEKIFSAFRRLFKDISDASEMQRLAMLIQYLGDSTYRADVDKLKEIIGS